MKPPFLKSTMTFCYQWMLAKSRHWLCLTFPVPSIPLTILFSCEDLMIVSGSLGSHSTGLSRIWLEDVRIKLGDSKADLPFGVPRGSVLGSLLFTLYTTPMSSMISGHTIPTIYSDDSQLYVAFASGDSAAALNGLQSLLASVPSWMSMTQLKLNPDESEFLIIGNWWQQSKYLSTFPIELFGVKTNPAKSAQNLGVIFGKNFVFWSHISAVSRPCFYHIRDLQRFRHYRDLENAKLLANALASSRRDYCNSLLSGIRDTDLWPQQTAMCSVSTGPHCNKVTFFYSVPLLRSVHRLPVKFRILFKISLLAYKSLHEQTACLSSLDVCPNHSHPVHWD